MERVRRLAVGAALLAASACTSSSKHDPSASVAASAALSSASSAQISSDAARTRIAELREAEHRRAAGLVSETDLTSRDVSVRRAAARALARTAGKASRDGLLHLLYDEDAEVTTWAAYGLGFDCAGDTREATVDALVARATALPEGAPFDPAFGSIARAVGGCASPSRSEATLVAWLGLAPERASYTCLALGDLAGKTKRLLEETWVSLFARAAGGVSDAALSEALFAVSRVENVPPSVVDRLAEVATARLADSGPYRLFAIRALGRAKGAALSGLEKVLLTDAASFTVPERVEAFRAAGRLGGDGQVLIGRVLEGIAAAQDKIARDNELATLTLAALASLKDPKAAPKALTVLKALPFAEGGSARTKRITSLVRCAAARVPPDVKITDPAVIACDLEQGWIGKRTTAEILGRTELLAPQKAVLAKLLADPDARVREAALELLSGHPEIDNTPAILVTALKAAEPGVVNVAAEQIHTSPRLASAVLPAKKKKKKDDKKIDPDKPAPPKPEDEPLPPPAKEVVSALVAALERAVKDNDPELLGALLDAIGALGEKSLLAKIEPFCKSADPSTREHVTNAIALLSGGKKPTCEAPARADTVGPEVSAPATEDVTIVFDTDAGELILKLDATLAPIATKRMTTLVERGYFNGNVLHRVDPSFVVQFGSPHADGYAGPPDLPPMRCETSPSAFEHGSVGVALSGRDTGSSQLFVMRGRHPHLDGKYAIVGRSKGPWDNVMEGDVIVKARIGE